MPSGEWDSFLKSNLKKYRKPEKTFKDVRPLLAEYKDLRPKVSGMEATGKGKNKKLICIQGTIPIVSPTPNQGRGFTLPVCVWLQDTHPDDPPACYLAPIKDFVIQPSKYLDSRGKIYLPYLHDWHAPRSNLSELFAIIRDIFGKHFPYIPATSVTKGGDVRIPAEGIPQLRGDRIVDPERVDHVMNKLPKPTEVLKDIQGVLDMFPDLRVKAMSHAFTEGPRTEHLAIDGTIPIVFKGGNYNIPIAVWLRNNYPLSHPHCFVIPTQGMMVKPSKFVDPSGKVYLPYMHEWKYPTTDLSGLIQVMCLTFGESCPVYSTTESSPSRNPNVQTEQGRQPGNDTILNMRLDAMEKERGSKGASATPDSSVGPSTSKGPRLRFGDGTLVKKIKAENERLKDSQLCKICMDTEMEVLFMPCNHFATCDECSKVLQKCPICRQDIQNTVRVYKS